MAAKFNVSTRTWGKYERGETVPDAATLALLGAEFEMNIMYILTGNRTQPDRISTEEQKLVENYRAMDEVTRLNIQTVSDVFAQSKSNVKKD